MPVARFVLRFKGERIRLASGDFTLGRGQDNGLPLDDERVSRHHALLHVTADTLTISDMESRNGVFVNGEQIEEPRELRHGDVFLLGNSEVEVIEEEERDRRAAMATVGSSDESEKLREKLKKKSDDTATLSVLSPREHEVLRLVAHGHTHREVAEKLDVSVKTIETYRARIAEKLDLRTRADLVRFAIDAGLLSKE